MKYNYNNLFFCITLFSVSFAVMFIESHNSLKPIHPWVVQKQPAVGEFILIHPNNYEFADFKRIRALNVLTMRQYKKALKTYEENSALQVEGLIKPRLVWES